VDNAFHLLSPLPQFVLPAAAPVDLVVAELPTGERVSMRCVGF
jgi:hypothetical protein